MMIMPLKFWFNGHTLAAEKRKTMHSYALLLYCMWAKGWIVASHRVHFVELWPVNIALVTRLLSLMCDCSFKPIFGCVWYIASSDITWCDNTSVGSEDYNYEKKEKSGGVALEKSDLTRPLWLKAALAATNTSKSPTKLLMVRWHRSRKCKTGFRTSRQKTSGTFSTQT